MVDMKKSKELFQKTTQAAFEQLHESFKEIQKHRDELKKREAAMQESSKILIDAMNQLEVCTLVFHERYTSEMATIVHLKNGIIELEQTHLLEHK